MISYILTLIVCYFGLVGGFIVKKFAKNEIKKVKRKFWFVEKSHFVYAALAVVFYFASLSDFFDSAASAIFIYGVAVGALKKDKPVKILLKNAIFLIALLGLLVLEF